MTGLLRVAAALLGAAIVLGAVDAPIAAAPPLALVVLRGSGAILTLEAGSAAADAGRFAFTAPGLGTYVPLGPADLRRDAAGNLHGSYRGLANVFASATATPVQVPITLELNVRVAGPQSGGEAELHAGDRAFHLEVLQAPKQLPTAPLVAFESAMRSSDWSSLYGLLSSDLASSMSAAAFAAEARAQTQSLGAITDIRRQSIGAVQTSAQGVIYATSRYTETRAGASSPLTYDAYFVYEDTGWKLWFTAAP